MKEDEGSWKWFVKVMVEHRLKDMRLVVGRRSGLASTKT